jgi:putative transposase
MGNHVHLMLTPAEPVAISRALHSASRRYAGYFNARYQRTGTLWEGRFYAAIIPTERYLFACYRYIDMNPVRAGLVPRPELYTWSSHRFYAAGEPDALVTPHPAILEFSADSRRRHAAYKALFDLPSDPADYDAIRKASKACRTIGADCNPRGRPRKRTIPDAMN